LEKIKNNIKSAGRELSKITIVAVTKTVAVEKIKEAAALGITDFGENRVQEFLSKYSELKEVRLEEVSWHQIGRLQTNKVKLIIDKVKLIQSVDSERLLLEINKRAAAANLVSDVLIEINIGGEEQKGGIPEAETENLLRAAANFKSVNVKGFMTVAPFAENPEDVRWVFKRAKNLFDALQKKYNLEILSMGMSNDYIVAVEEGSTMIRVGSGIFKKQNI
jgi:pyridoxal phosphate enzyme (YggS family)